MFSFLKPANSAERAILISCAFAVGACLSLPISDYLVDQKIAQEEQVLQNCNALIAQHNKRAYEVYSTALMEK